MNVFGQVGGTIVYETCSLKTVRRYEFVEFRWSIWREMTFLSLGAMRDGF